MPLQDGFCTDQKNIDTVTLAVRDFAPGENPSVDGLPSSGLTSLERHDLDGV